VRKALVVVASASLGVLFATTPAFAVSPSINSPASPWTVPENNQGIPQTTTDIVVHDYGPTSGLPAGVPVYLEQCDGLNPATPGWSPTADCDIGTSPAAGIPDAVTGNYTFSHSDSNHAFTPFHGTSPSGEFDCLGPTETVPNDFLPHWRDCQLRASTNNGAVTGDQQFVTLTLPDSLTPVAPTNPVASEQVGQVTVQWNTPVYPGSSAITSETVTATPGGATCMVTMAPFRCAVSGLTNGTIYRFTVKATNGTGDSPDSTMSAPFVPGLGTYHSLTPCRVLDTRFGTGGLSTFTPNQTQELPFTSGTATACGVPATHVKGVLLNVTATGPTQGGWLTISPGDATIPNASNLNFAPGQTVPNLVAVKLGATGPNAGNVEITNTDVATPPHPPAGSVNVIADVTGYYGDGTETLAGQFTGVTPSRIMDTRFPPGSQNPSGLSTFTPGQTQDLTVGGVGGVPADADSVVMNVTAVGPTDVGFLTLFPKGATLPNASNLNLVAGQPAAPNLVTVKLGTSGKVSINNSGGCSCTPNVDVIADVLGYYRINTPSIVSGIINPISPQRILDTRFGTGGVTGPIGPQQTVTVDPEQAFGLPPLGMYTGVVVNVTETGATGPGWLNVYPSMTSLPTASNLNFVGGQTVPNLVKLKVGTDGKISITNTGGGSGGPNVQIIVDLVGFYS
jgi:hypothetical protein